MFKLISHSTANDIRTEAIKGVIDRLEILKGGSIAVDKERIVAAIQALENKGCLTKSGGSFFYTPSFHTRLAVYNAILSDGWNVATQKKMKAAFRQSVGAIFKFPIENSSGSEITTIEAFITDWSPFPAAAAIALHPSHPLLQGKGREEEEYFSNTWVRHPLTGDVLPVWVCPWVLPDFGTGAVIVNPAHSQVDLEFAQRVGLPIKFALASNRVTANPETWQRAPVIKEGKTVKTGNHDNLSVEEAVEVYYDELSQHGWAEKKTDQALRVGTIKIASSNFDIEPFLEALLSVDPSQPFKLFCPVQQVDSVFLLARHLWHDLYNLPFKPTNIQLWQPVPQTGSGSSELALLVSGPLENDFKKQVLSQCTAFLKNHSELLTFRIEEVSNLAAAYVKIKENLLKCEYHTAFKSLLDIQRNLLKNPEKVVSSEYFVFAYLLSSEISLPAELDLSAVWANINTLILRNQESKQADTTTSTTTANNATTTTSTIATPSNFFKSRIVPEEGQDDNKELAEIKGLTTGSGK